MIPVQYFQYPPRPPAEHKQVAREGLLIHLRLGDDRKTVYLLTHVRNARAYKDSHPAEIYRHARLPIRATTHSRARRSVPKWTSICTPLGNRSVSPEESAHSAVQVAIGWKLDRRGRLQQIPVP